MELHHDDRIFFDPTSHSYLLDGEKLLMGVTELMAKHNLGADYGGIKKEVLDNAAKVGTEIHREIQDYLSGETIFASELIDEVKKLNLKFVAAEYLISDYQTVASAIDLVCEGSAPDKAILIDIKSTEKYHRRAVEWQLGGYKEMFEAQNPGIEVEALFCLHIDKKARKLRGFYPVEGVTSEEWNALLEAERNGLIYIDENAVPDASLVLEEDELQTYIARAAQIAELKTKIKEIEDAMKFCDERMLAYMADNNLDEMAAPGGVFKRKKAYTRTTVDSARLKSLFPHIFEKVAKTVDVSSSLTFYPSEK